jgi:AbrB family looped-hinge helix DNA binding protein
VRITSKGQVTIPAEIRERTGLLPQTEVEFEFDGRPCASFAPKPVRGTAGALDLLLISEGAAMLQ